jgi:glycosyltransferase involved in cell wall biosynthesis
VDAFTTKAAKFLSMMGDRGHDIVVYGGELSEPARAELVPTFSDAERGQWYGDLDPNTLPTVAATWDAGQVSYLVTNTRAAHEIGERYERGDIVLLSGGLAQKPIADRLPNALVAEWAAAYPGWFAPYVCFESHAWRHYCYGRWGQHWGAEHTGRWFDAVIPNFFDPEEWPLGDEKQDYLAFCGRLIANKGAHVAAEIARELGMTLLIAGPGMAEYEEGRYLLGLDGTRLEGDIHYLGTLGPAARNSFIGSARALLSPSLYVEPFGAVVVEAMLLGTPSITTDWGSFTELLPRERRFRTLAEGCEAVLRAMELEPADLQREALARWSFDAVAPMYEEWFGELASLWGDGWYQRPERRSPPAS